MVEEEQKEEREMVNS
jgi:hypothetical protein